MPDTAATDDFTDETQSVQFDVTEKILRRSHIQQILFLEEESDSEIG